MSDATLKIELIGATDEEKAAFHGPDNRYQPQSSQSPDRHQVPDLPDAGIPTSQPTDGTQSPTTQRKPSSSEVPQYTPVFESVDALIRKIDELIVMERDKSQKSKNQPEEKKPETFTARIADKIDRFMQRLDAGLGKSQLGNSPGGRILRAGVNRARSMGGKLYRAAGRTRVGNALGRGVNRVAARLAPSAGAAAGGAAGAAGSSAAAGSVIASVAGPVATVGAAALGAAAGLVAAGEVAHQFAKSLEDLSPELARTKALFESNRELARLDRAQRVGGAFASIEQSRNRLSESMYEVQTKILEIIAKFAPLIEAVLDGINVGVRGLDVLLAKIAEIWSKINDLPIFGGDLSDNQSATDALNKAVDGLKQAFDEFTKANQQPGGGMDPWLAEVLRMGAPAGARRAVFPPNQGQFP